VNAGNCSGRCLVDMDVSYWDAGVWSVVAKVGEVTADCWKKGVRFIVKSYGMRRTVVKDNDFGRSCYSLDDFSLFSVVFLLDGLIAIKVVRGEPGRHLEELETG
jgi:hypothetical protein